MQNYKRTANMGSNFQAVSVMEKASESTGP